MQLLPGRGGAKSRRPKDRIIASPGIPRNAFLARTALFRITHVSHGRI